MFREGVMLKKVDAELGVYVMVECPQCQEPFNLLDIKNLTEEDYIYKELLPDDEPWGKEQWGEIVECPNCGYKMLIDSVVW